MSALRSDLVDQLKASLKDAATKFDAGADADFIRHLNHAAVHLSVKRRRTLGASIALQAGVEIYPAPSDLIKPKGGVWGEIQQRSSQPWERGHPGRLPTLTVVEDAGAQALRVYPAPTASQIACLGANYRYFYYAAHVLSDVPGDTTVLDKDTPLLLLLATIEAMKELANGGAVKPIQLHKGLGSTAKSGTPAEWVKWLTEQYEVAA